MAAKDTTEGGSSVSPPPLFGAAELGNLSFYGALLAEFIATFLFLYITVLTVIGYKSQTDSTKNDSHCNGLAILGIAWSFGGMIFVLVYCIGGISGEFSFFCSTSSQFSQLKRRSTYNIKKKRSDVYLNYYSV